MAVFHLSPRPGCRRRGKRRGFATDGYGALAWEFTRGRQLIPRVTDQGPDYTEPLRLTSLGTSPFRGGMATNDVPKPPLKGEVALPQAGSEGFHNVNAEL